MCGRSRGTIVLAMTETLQDPPLPPPPPPPRLVRDPDDKIVAGVCSGLGRYTDSDPVLWRVALAALALFGGAGIALYALAWLLIPRADSPTSFAERHLRRPDSSVSVAGVVLTLIITLLILGLADGTGVVVLAVIAALVYLVARERRSSPGQVPQAPAAWVPAAPASAYGVPPVPGQSYAPPAMSAAPRSRQRSRLGPLTLSAAALITGLLLLLRELGADGLTGPRVLAGAMLVVGAGLVVGTWYGRARWLIAVGLLLAVALAGAQAASTAADNLSGGAGERLWVPTAASGVTSYELGAGEATLDLRELEPGSVDSIAVEVGFGSLVVLVPDDLPVRVSPDVGLGEVISATEDAGSGTSERRQIADDEVLQLGPDSGPVLDLRLRVGLGEIEVRRAQR